MNWWRHVVSMELRKILAYRSDFWVTFLGQVLIQLVIARALWENIFAFEGKEVMEGFTLPMMTLYFLIVPLGSKMLMGENMGFLSREIYDGTFTRYLIYPVSFFQYKTLTYLTHSCFYGVQLVLLYLLYNAFLGEINPAMFQNLLLGAGVFLVASLAYCMLSCFFELISLWAENIWAVMVMIRFIVYFLGGSFIPLTFFPKWSAALLAWTPFPYMISLPARTVIGLSSSQEILQGIFILLIWALFFMGSAIILWKKGEKNYAGVGI